MAKERQGIEALTRRAVDEYFRCVIERDDEGIFELFAPDARVVLFLGTVLEGNGEIRDYMSKNAFKRALEPMPLEPIIDGNRAAVEVDIRRGLLWHRAMDVFTVRNDGRVVSLWVYDSHSLREGSASFSDRALRSRVEG